MSTIRLYFAAADAGIDRSFSPCTENVSVHRLSMFRRKENLCLVEIETWGIAPTQWTC